MTTTQPLDAAAVLDALSEFDETDLELVVAGVKARRSQLRTLTTLEVVGSLNVGDRVKLTGLRPQYVNGATGTVESLAQTRFNVRLDDDVDPRARARFGEVVRVPASALVKL